MTTTYSKLGVYKISYRIYEHHSDCLVHERFEAIMSICEHPSDVLSSIDVFCTCPEIKAYETTPQILVGTTSGSRIWTGESWEEIPFADEDETPTESTPAYGDMMLKEGGFLVWSRRGWISAEISEVSST